MSLHLGLGCCLLSEAPNLTSSFTCALISSILFFSGFFTMCLNVSIIKRNKPSLESPVSFPIPSYLPSLLRVAFVTSLHSSHSSAPYNLPFALSHATEAPFTFPRFVDLSLLSSLFLFIPLNRPPLPPSFFLATPLRPFEGNSLLPIFEKFLFLRVPSLAVFFLYSFELSSPWPGLLLLFVSRDTRIYISSPYFCIEIQILMSSLSGDPTDSLTSHLPLNLILFCVLSWWTAPLSV